VFALAVFALAVLALAALALTVPAQAQKFGQATSRTSRPSEYSDSYAGRHALILGNFDYDNYEALPGVRRDMARMEEAFETVGFTVHVDSNLTRAGLDRKLTWFFDTFGRARSQKDNALVVYYAGHGERENYSGWLVPVNSPEKPPFQDEDAYMAWEDSLLSVTELVSKTDKVKAKHVLFILDGCYLGSIITEPPGGQQPSLLRRNLMENPSRYVLTSGPYDRRVNDDSQFTDGLFSLLTKETPQLGRNGTDGSGGGPFWTGLSLGISLSGLDYGQGAQPQHGVFRQLRTNEAEQGGIVIEASAFSPEAAPSYDNRLVAGTLRIIKRGCLAAGKAEDPEEMISELEDTDSILSEEYPHHNSREWTAVWDQWQNCLAKPALEVPNALLERYEYLSLPLDAGSGIASNQ
jgi:Caspase domain